MLHVQMPVCREDTVRQDSCMAVLQEDEHVVLEFEENVSFEQSVLLLDGKMIRAPEFDLEEGEHLLSYELKDDEGNILESDEQILICDQTPPVIEANTDLVYVYSQRPFSFSVREEHPGWNLVSVDQVEKADEQVELIRGNREIWIRSEDQFGNRSERTVEVRDLELPASPFDQTGIIALPSRSVSMKLRNWEDFSLRVRYADREETLSFNGETLDFILEEDQADLILEHPGLQEIIQWTVQCQPPAPELSITEQNSGSGQNENSFELPFHSRGQEGQDSMLIEPPSSQDLMISQTEASLSEPVSQMTFAEETALPVQAAASPIETDRTVNRPAEPAVSSAASHAKTPFQPSLVSDTPFISTASQSPLSAAPTAAKQEKIRSPLLSLGDQKITQGKTFSASSLSDLRLDLDGLSDSQISVHSVLSGNTYTSLSQAIAQEKTPILEIEASGTGSDGSQQKSRWTAVEVPEAVRQDLEVPFAEGSRWYALDEQGKMNSYRQTQPSSALLCRGFEQLQENVTSGKENLRLYVDEKEQEYTLTVNGKTRTMSPLEDELGQPYLPVTSGLARTEISAQAKGRTVYSGTLRSSVPLSLMAMTAPVLGALCGLFLEGRRRRAARNRLL